MRRLSLLGHFEFVVDGRSVGVTAKGQRVLSYLALRGGMATREQLAGALWPEGSDARARANLRTTMWRLRAHDARLIDDSASTLALAADVEVDVWQARSHGEAIVRGTISRPPDGDHHLLLQELLPGWYEDWVVIAQARHDQLRLHALEQLCADLRKCGRFAESIDIGLAAVGLEPLRESAHREVITTHLQEGNRSEALRHYRSVQVLLADALDIEPSPMLTALVESFADLAAI